MKLDSKKKVALESDLKKEYITPDFKSHTPLKIMSAWKDRSSELSF